VSEEEFLDMIKSKGLSDYEKFNDKIMQLRDKLGLIIKEEKSPEEKYFLLNIPDD